MNQNEDKIIEACKRGDREAFKYIFDTYSRKLLAVAARYTVDIHEAEDVLQESFIKVYQTISSFEGKGSFEGWLRRVVVTTSLNHYKSRKAKTNDLMNEELDMVEDNKVTIEAQIDGEELMKIIHQLPEGYRIVFNMYVVEGYNHREIGEQLGISEGTSKSQLAKAKKTLRGILENQKLVA